MLIYANADGELIRELKTQLEQDQFGPPDNYAEVIEIDPETNEGFLRALYDEWENLRLSGGQFTLAGNVLVINPPGEKWIERERQESSQDDASAIPGWASWTEDEALAWLDTNIADRLGAVPDVDNLTAEQYRNNAQAIDAQWQDVFAAQQQVIRALVRLVVALRNQAWPKLEGS